jgi:Fructose-2,6-bisphosphatase
MKILASFFFVLFLFSFAADVRAQEREMTIILVRHCEKDLSLDPFDPDAELSVEGKKRAERFAEVARRYKPDAIYSSMYKRTIATVAPLADSLDPKYRMMIQFYNHRELDSLISRMMNSGAKTIVVAGHNSTTPRLANLLIKEDKYEPLEENEYDKIFVIKLKRGAAQSEVITY